MLFVRSWALLGTIHGVPSSGRAAAGAHVAPRMQAADAAASLTWWWRGGGEGGGGDGGGGEGSGGDRGDGDSGGGSVVAARVAVERVAEVMVETRSGSGPVRVLGVAGSLRGSRGTAVIGVGQEWQRPLACARRSRPFAWAQPTLKRRGQGVGVRQRIGSELGSAHRNLTTRECRNLSTRECLAAPRRNIACHCTQPSPTTRGRRSCGGCSTLTQTASGQRLP
eukprot:scaffold129274_cov39-Phaeocystis_antarctica.AAC.1